MLTITQCRVEARKKATHLPPPPQYIVHVGILADIFDYTFPHKHIGLLEENQFRMRIGKFPLIRIPTTANKAEKQKK